MMCGLGGRSDPDSKKEREKSPPEIIRNSGGSSFTFYSAFIQVVLKGSESLGTSEKRLS